MKQITLLGSTGSIGTQTLSVVRENPELSVAALAAYGNIDLLEKQIREFCPGTAVVYEEKQAKVLSERLKLQPVFDPVRRETYEVEVLSGMEGLLSICEIPEVDIVLSAVVGMIGIRPVLHAISHGKDIALANKETLVTAGHLIMPYAEEKQVRILPVDSEHSAIFQALQGEENSTIEKILLTASGGPFYGKRREELKDITAKDALAHPTWNMGQKVTIDSSTLVNKGLEVMEAAWLFSVPANKIQVVVQPQSIVHSMVQFSDGAVMAQMGVPDMKLPIQYALTYPTRKKMGGDRLDFEVLTSLRFGLPDMEAFPGLRLAYEASEAGGSLPTVFNAADEAAVELFLKGRIGYLDVADTIESCMDRHSVIAHPSLEEILEVERETRKRVLEAYS